MVRFFKNKKKIGKFSKRKKKRIKEVKFIKEKRTEITKQKTKQKMDQTKSARR